MKSETFPILRRYSVMRSGNWRHYRSSVPEVLVIATILTVLGIRLGVLVLDGSVARHKRSPEADAMVRASCA